MKRPTFRLSKEKHRQLMSELRLEGLTFQEFGEYVVNLYLSGELKLKGEEKMLRKK